MSVAKKHIIFWIAYFGYCCITDFTVDSAATISSECLFFVTQNLFLFYTLLFFLRKFNSKNTNDRFNSLLILLGIIITFAAIRYVTRYWLLAHYVNPEFGQLLFQHWVISGIIWITNYFIFAAAYFYFERSIERAHSLNTVREDALLKDKRNLELENTLLRAQINPHFLYNSLNFLYANALPLSAPLSEAILKLSEIMRYSIRPQDADGLVALSDEAEHISNVIEMAKLRFSNKIAIHLNTKHADLNDPLNPATIRIGVNTGKNIAFTTWNKKRLGPKEFSTGIGLQNTVRRLKDAYKETCTVTISDEEFEFAVNVRIEN